MADLPLQAPPRYCSHKPLRGGEGLVGASEALSPLPRPAQPPSELAAVACVPVSVERRCGGREASGSDSQNPGPSPFSPSELFSLYWEDFHFSPPLFPLQFYLLYWLAGRGEGRFNPLFHIVPWENRDFFLKVKYLSAARFFLLLHSQPFCSN